MTEPKKTVTKIKMHCDTHGEFDSEEVEIEGMFSFKKPCFKCAEEYAERKRKDEEEKVKYEKRQKMAMLRHRSNIPPRFQDMSFDNYTPEGQDSAKAKKICHAFAEKFLERLEVGGCLVLCGLPGTGKTHLACSIANHVLNIHEKSALFVSVIDAMRSIRETYNKDVDTLEREAIGRLVEPDLLIFDEVGVQSGSDHEKQNIFDVINKRYERYKPTILISNLEVEDLSLYVGERVMSRMNQSGGTVISFTWSDYRVAKK